MVKLRGAITPLLIAVVVATPAAAASIDLTTASLGAATVAAPRCTSAGLAILQNLSGSSVISVTISNLPAACGGAIAQATVNNGSANSSGSATVPGGGGSVTVVLAAAVAVSASEATDVVLTGP